MGKRLFRRRGKHWAYFLKRINTKNFDLWQMSEYFRFDFDIMGTSILIWIWFWDWERRSYIWSEKWSYPLNKSALSGMEHRLQDWCKRVNVCRQSTIGLGMWGDGAPFSHKDSVNLVLWNIASGGKRALQRYWLCAFTKSQECKCGCKGSHTWDAIWAVVIWIFSVLLVGRQPLKRHDDIPWEDNAYFGSF